jgi:hypothetical protein
MRFFISFYEVMPKYPVSKKNGKDRNNKRF